MKYFKFYLEALITLLVVALLTIITYHGLVGYGEFWTAQTFWSSALLICWAIVSAGYYHQGWLIRKDHSTAHVSVILPIAVFVVQCILFIKGIYFNDWSLIVGAVIVNSGVLFSLYHIFMDRIKHR